MKQPVLFVVALMLLVFCACEHKDVPQPADPQPTDPKPTDPPPSKYGWTINGVFFSLDSSIKAAWPALVNVYETVQAVPDGTGLIIEFQGGHSKELYTVFNHGDYNSFINKKDHAHITLNANGKVYRNYKQAQKVLKVNDWITRSIESAGVWLFNAADINDSVNLKFTLDAIPAPGVSHKESSWSIDGAAPHLVNVRTSPNRPFYTFTHYKNTDINNFISVQLWSKHINNGTYRLGMSGWDKIMFRFKFNSVPQSGYSIDGYHIKELDTNHTAQIALLDEGMEVSFKDKVVLIAPFAPGGPSIPPVSYDTFRVSANLLVSTDW